MSKGSNSAAVDLFRPSDHAEKVLAAFGRAFGKLAGQPRRNEQGEKESLLDAIRVAGLAEEGKVICVRLALFAEMMKGKAWTPAYAQGSGRYRGAWV